MLTQDMKDRIAKVAAEQSYHAAQRRLHKDGAGANKSVWRRLELIARERQLPRADVAKATRSLAGAIALCDKYGISTDWLLIGDLKGLLRTVHEARLITPDALESQATEVASRFKQLTPRERIAVLNGMRQKTDKKAKP